MWKISSHHHHQQQQPQGVPLVMQMPAASVAQVQQQHQQQHQLQQQLSKAPRRKAALLQHQHLVV
jgi:hypothetical protein